MSTNNRLEARLNQIKNEQPVTESVESAAAKAADMLEEEIPAAVTSVINDDVDVIDGGEVGQITIEEKDVVEAAPAVGDDLFDGLRTLDEETAAMSEALHAKQAEINEGIVTAENPGVKTNEDDVVDGDDIGAIISNIIEKDVYEEPVPDINENTDLEDLVRRYDESKVFGEHISSKNDYTGPSAYVIEENEDFVEAIDSALSENNIKFAKSSGPTRNALLERYTNVGPNVAVPLPNSGIFVQISGAGIDELIAMSQIESENHMYDELNKLKFICDHIVDSSVGPLSLKQLIKIVSFHDLPTLYYGLLAATHPEKIEITRTCPICGEEYFVTTGTRDLLINPTDFKKAEVDIRNNVTTYQRLINTSNLGKVYSKVHSNGRMIVYCKHPSIESYLTTYNNLTAETMQRYREIYGYVYSIDKIALRDKNGTFIEYKDPNEIVLILSRIKNPAEKYEILDMTSAVRADYIPVYGYQEGTCPHCSNKNIAEKIDIGSLLFTLAQHDQWYAEMRYAAKLQKEKKAALQKSE